jgi:quercetin dioxygenase-like cupin family protein
MNGLDAAKDLARVEPRALDAELDGYAWLPRMLDKARATLAGTNGSYLFGCPIDHTCMARLGISQNLVLDLAGRYGDDEDVMIALQDHGIPPAPEAWFDGQAVEDELQGPGWYLRVRPTESTPGPDDSVIELKPATQEPPRVSSSEEVVAVIEGEITVFLGKHQARTVRTGETVWVPAGVEWWFQNTDHRSARLIRPGQA